MPSRGRLIFIALSLLTVSLTLAGALLASSNRQQSDDPEDSPYKYLSVFMEVFGLVNKAYVDEPESETLIAGALEGTLDALDPFSLYIPPAAADGFEAVREVDWRHSGMVVLKERGVAYVVAVMEGGPAEQAGVELADILVQVNGAPTRQTPLYEIYRTLTAETGTEVELEILRLGQKKDVTLVLEEFDLPGVVLEADKGIPVLRIPGFFEDTYQNVKGGLETIASHRLVDPPPPPAEESEDTADEATSEETTAEEVTSEETTADADTAPAAPETSAEPASANADDLLPGLWTREKLLIDLRGVSGGDEKVAYRVASLFASGVLGALENRDQEIELFENEEPPAFEGRIVVLVNRGTQGAAEILASVLQSSASAALVGERTFGHSGRQSLVELSDGGRLQITSAFFTGPDREPINEGLDPDVRTRGAFLTSDAEGESVDPVRDRGLTFLIEDEEIEEEEKAAA